MLMGSLIGCRDFRNLEIAETCDRCMSTPLVVSSIYTHVYIIIIILYDIIYIILCPSKIIGYIMDYKSIMYVLCK